MKKFGDQRAGGDEPFLEVGEYGEGGKAEFFSDGAAPAGNSTDAGTVEEEDDAPDLLGIYFDEVKAIPEFGDGEEEALTKRASQGDPAARDRLMEGYLKHALTIVREYMGGPVSVPELIGISNLSMVKAVRTWLDHQAAPYAVPAGKTEDQALASLSLRDTITATVRTDLAAAVERENFKKKEADDIAGRANRLTETARVMAGELGRQATPEELSERMRIPVEEVKELIRMTMQAM